MRTSATLREALLRLLERKPFDQITVRDICAESGVHYATFFRHHASKEALLEYVATDQIKQLVEFTLPIWDSIGDSTGFRALFDYIDEHRALWTALLNGGASAAMEEEWLRQSRIVAGTHESRSNWLPVELGIKCSISLFADTISWWLRQPEGAYSVDQVSDILQRLVSSSTLSPD